MSKILILDTLYPAFISSLPQLTGTYDEELAKLMLRGFGTFDAFSHYLTAESHTVLDIVANHEALQRLWAKSNGYPIVIAATMGLDEILRAQVFNFRPDAIVLQDIGYLPAHQLRDWKYQGITLAAQCSCALNPNLDLSPLDIVFTSLPSHVNMFKAKGVRAEYLPLAFDPRMRPPERIRDLDISFVGGVGRDSHWKRGTDTLEAVAAAFPERFHFYGYGLENLAAKSPLRKCYRGPAWGRAMYEVYARSKCVVNRHGEVSQGFSNNLRMYESTGCGALLFTEESHNIRELFPQDTVATYSNPTELCEKLKYFLDHDPARQLVSSFGQRHTDNHHTYAQRMKTVSRVLTEVLEARKVSA